MSIARSVVRSVSRSVASSPIRGGVEGGGGPTFDSDAAAYMAAVAIADGEELEIGVQTVVNQLFLDLKAAGLYATLAAGAFNLLDAPRTLNGCLVPIGANTPTNNNFEVVDFTRGTGWKGNGTNKTIASGRNNNTDGQNDQSLWVWVTESPTASLMAYIGADNLTAGSSAILRGASTNLFVRSREGSTSLSMQVAGTSAGNGFLGKSRTVSTEFRAKVFGAAVETITRDSVAPTSGEIIVFSRGTSMFSDCRIAAYGAHAGVDLDALSTAISTYRTSLAAALA